MSQLWTLGCKALIPWSSWMWPLAGEPSETFFFSPTVVAEVGRLKFELFHDQLPITSENFRCPLRGMSNWLLRKAFVPVRLAWGTGCARDGASKKAVSRGSQTCGGTGTRTSCVWSPASCAQGSDSATLLPYLSAKVRAEISTLASATWESHPV